MHCCQETKPQWVPLSLEYTAHQGYSYAVIGPVVNTTHSIAVAANRIRMDVLRRSVRMATRHPALLLPSDRNPEPELFSPLQSALVKHRTCPEQKK